MVWLTIARAGGEVELQAQQVQLTEEAIISSSSSGEGDAGDIHIAVQVIDLRGNSMITTTVDRGEASGLPDKRASFVDCLVMATATFYDTRQTFGFDTVFGRNGILLPGNAEKQVA